MIIVALTGGGSRASKRSLVVRIPLSGPPVPCSGARRQDKALDEVSAAILGDAVAENNILNSFLSISGSSEIVNANK